MSKKIESLSKVKGSFALIDVNKGHKRLVGYLKKHGPVKVIMEGYIDGQWGKHDGKSQEFSVELDKVTLVEE